jgi:hypothetical protein
MNPTPQQNVNGAMQQSNSDVMNLIKNKGKPQQPAQVEKAKEQLKQVIIQNQLDPKGIVYAGKIAQAALKDPKMYQVAIQTAIKQNLISPQEVSKQGIDYKLLGMGITAGRLTEQLISEGAL